MISNWYVWEEGLSDEVIDGIIERCEELPVVDSNVNFVGNSDHSTRRSKIRWVFDDSELRKIIWDNVITTNGIAFGFDIIDKFDIQYTTYLDSDSGCYNWHRDSNLFGYGFYDRKLSVSIQLNDPSEYEGGKFEFEIDGEIVSPEGFEKKGSILVFPSFLRHRVTEVTKGTRNSLVSWIQGPQFR